MLFRLQRASVLQKWRRYYSAASGQSGEAFLSRSEKHDGQIAFLNLNRPAAKNALSMQLLHDMRNAIHQVRFDGQTRAVIVQSSSSGVFCAGADLKQRRSMTPAQVAEFLYTLRQMLAELERVPIPTIAALDGAALGGGLELALACDMRVASSAAAKIGLPETRLAIIPGAGGTQRLSRLIGTAKAKELIFTSRTMTAAQARDLGIINHVSEEGKTATERAIELAEEILPAGPLAIRAAKLAIDKGAPLDLEAGLDLEATAYQTIIPSKDRLEGLKAFAEKRKPAYKGE